MDVTEAIHKRRAYRSLLPVQITRELVEDLAAHGQLSASCFNNQPWRFVFVYEEDMLREMHKALSKGNRWVKLASMIIAVFSKPEDDCQIRDRVYNLFDTGMATAFLILRATELGLVAHPIAGFSPRKVKETLGIPEEYQVITLVNVGKHSDKVHPYLSEKQAQDEARRPPRHPLTEFAYHNHYPTDRDQDE
jgi:nitroreductase